MRTRRLIAAPMLLAVLAGLAAAGPLTRRHRTSPTPQAGLPAYPYQLRASSPPVIALSRTAVLLLQDEAEAERQWAAMANGPFVETESTEAYRTDRDMYGRLRIEQRHEYNEATADRQRQGNVSIDEGWRLGVKPQGWAQHDEQWRTVRSSSQPQPPGGQRGRTKLFQLETPQLTIDHCEISGVALLVHEGDGAWVLSLRADQNRMPDVPGQYVSTLHLRRNEFVVKARAYGDMLDRPAGEVAAVGRPMVAQLGPWTFQVESRQPRYVRLTGRSEELRKYYQYVDRVEIEFSYR